MKILITGGGTGGHLAIAKTLGEEIKKRNIDTKFVGSTNGQDRAWFENSKIFDEKIFLQSSGVVNKHGLAKFSAVFNIINLSSQVCEILRTDEICAVISVGGYSAAPAAIAALREKKPLFIHEQNAIIGRLNRLLKPFSRGFYSSYFEPKFSYPVSEIYFRTARTRTNLKTIIFLGGSQGAKFINDLALNLAPNLNSHGIKIIHQCGAKDYERVANFYAQNEINADAFGFCDDLASKISQADLCVGRSGASTLWELCAAGLPAIFVPFPYAANNHQYFNAKFLADRNLAKIFTQNEISNEQFLDEILNFNIAKVSDELKDILAPNAANLIVDDILDKLEK